VGGLLDLKSGKSQTGRSLIDRGAMYEGRPAVAAAIAFCIGVIRKV
jgi:hypothetical protein